MEDDDEDLILFDNHLMGFETLVGPPPPPPRPFWCPMCGYRYVNKGDLVVHIKDRHPVAFPDLRPLLFVRYQQPTKPHPCPVYQCPHSYVFEKDMVRHVKRKHQLEKNGEGKWVSIKV